MWQLKETNIFARWYKKLTIEQSRVITKKILVLKEIGNTATIKQGSKALGSGLFELRDKNLGLRVYYTFHGQQVIFLLNGGNKNTKKQQSIDIQKARNLIRILEQSYE